MWWVMMSVAVLVGAATAVHEPISCNDASAKCALRSGCGMALQNYMLGCSGVLMGPPPTYCPEICQHSLIALTSTEEGKNFMACKCSDDACEDAKKRVEVCRPQVILANKNETVVSCTVAQRICEADTLCITALEYYNRFCRAMFHGRKCTYKCLNSINILRRQEKAAKLENCKCEGHEEYDCKKIQSNMARLCFHKVHHKKVPEVTGDVETNVIRDNNDAPSTASALASASVAFIGMLALAIT